MKELSIDNPYYISKHRYYELKHYCLQYPEWEHMIRLKLSESLKSSSMLKMDGNKRFKSDKVSEIASLTAHLQHQEEEIFSCCMNADPLIATYIFKAVTEGKSYDTLVVDGIPCGREYFYIRYRKFFYLLSILKQ